MRGRSSSIRKSGNGTFLILPVLVGPSSFFPIAVTVLRHGFGDGHTLEIEVYVPDPKRERFPRACAGVCGEPYYRSAYRITSVRFVLAEKRQHESGISQFFDLFLRKEHLLSVLPLGVGSRYADAIKRIAQDPPSAQCIPHYPAERDVDDLIDVLVRQPFLWPLRIFPELICGIPLLEIGDPLVDGGFVYLLKARVPPLGNHIGTQQIAVLLDAAVTYVMLGHTPLLSGLRERAGLILRIDVSAAKQVIIQGGGFFFGICFIGKALGLRLSFAIIGRLKPSDQPSSPRAVFRLAELVRHIRLERVPRTRQRIFHGGSDHNRSDCAVRQFLVEALLDP